MAWHLFSLLLTCCSCVLVNFPPVYEHLFMHLSKKAVPVCCDLKGAADGERSIGDNTNTAGGNDGKPQAYRQIYDSSLCLIVNICVQITCVEVARTVRPVVCWFLSHLFPLIEEGTESQGTCYLGNRTLLIYRVGEEREKEQEQIRKRNLSFSLLHIWGLFDR